MSSNRKLVFLELIKKSYASLRLAFKQLYNKVTHNIVSDVRHITLDDGMHIRVGSWVKAGFGRNKGNMLVLPGRREFIEEYQYVIDEFVDRGFHVWSMDWRGQGASSRMLNHPNKGHIDSYETYIHDLNHLINSYILPQSDAPLYAFAHSMGGHVMLRYLLENQKNIIKATILSAPMLDIRTDPYPLRVARALTKAMMMTGNSERYIFGEKLYDPESEIFEGNPFTSSESQFMHRMKMQQEHPHCAVDGFTFGWLDATFKSIDKFKKSLKETNLTSPILILSPKDDVLIRPEVYPEICEVLSQCVLKVYVGARHCLMDEDEQIRSQIWQDVDEFIAAQQAR
jgi:lysophospholipase